MDAIEYIPEFTVNGKAMRLVMEIAAALERYKFVMAVFQGRRDLFAGLAIAKTDWDWKNEIYPVLHLDMSIPATHNVACVRRTAGIRASAICEFWKFFW